MEKLKCQENGTKRIVTSNLILRKFVENDYIQMYENWANNPHVASKAGWPVHKEMKSTQKLVNIWVKEYENENVFNWIIVEKKSNLAIGSISVVSMDLNNRVCEIGYNIGEKWWNNGYITEAIRVVTNYLFSTNIFDVITASCFEDNIASMKVLEKNNFVFEGCLREVIIDDKKKKLLQFSLLKSENK